MNLIMKELHILMINIYTDGAHSSATDCGGWAIIITNAQDEPIAKASNYEMHTTNNRMELTAVLNALRCAITNYITEQINIHTDSAYIANAFKDKWYIKWRNNGWRTANKTPVLNQDLWEQIIPIVENSNGRITIHKISGHNGNKWNEYADTLAVAAREEGAKSYVNKTT